MARKLVVTAGPDEGRTVILPDDSTVLLGRSKAQTDNPINDPQVSRVHCQVEVQSGKSLLTDLDSGSGTLVNGRKITQHQLRHGDIIRIGSTQLNYLDGDAPPPKAVVEPEVVTRLEDLTGRTLSHYDVGAVLAKGASGIVFKGHDKKHDRAGALKVLWPELSRSDEEMKRFTRAMKTMLPLSHPNLVTIHNAGRTGPYCWIAMELVEGDSVATIIDRIGTEGMLDWRYALRIAIHVVLALEYALQHHFIHRNITPRNILIRWADQVAKLGDLMLAKAVEGSLAEQITRTGELLGDVAYLSPERTRSSKDVDGRSDLYSLGATTYALLTGKPPFTGLSLAETITKIRQAEPVKPKQSQPTMPDLFQTAVLRMLAKRPEDRFQTPAELLLHLEHIARTEGVSV